MLQAHVLRSLRAHGVPCIRRVPSPAARVVQADRGDDRVLVAQAVRVVDQALAHGQDLAHGQAHRVPVACCRQRARFRADVLLAAPRSVAAAINVTKRPRKAR